MKKANQFIYWLPRILGIILILFVMMFSLDIFDMGLTAGEIIIGLLMHNIPAYILTAILIISWKNEMFGGIIFMISGLICLFVLSWSLILCLPIFLISILFFVSWYKKIPPRQ